MLFRARARARVRYIVVVDQAEYFDNSSGEAIGERHRGRVTSRVRVALYLTKDYLFINRIRLRDIVERGETETIGPSSTGNHLRW